MIQVGNHVSVDITPVWYLSCALCRIHICGAGRDLLEGICDLLGYSTQDRNLGAREPLLIVYGEMVDLIFQRVEHQDYL